MFTAFHEGSLLRGLAVGKPHHDLAAAERTEDGRTGPDRRRLAVAEGVENRPVDAQGTAAAAVGFGVGVAVAAAVVDAEVGH